MTDLGIWVSSSENYYYRKIYKMVSAKIMPKIWQVAGLMLKSPHNEIYWGSYLVKICEETKELCMQFESVVTNGLLSFSDILFLEIKADIADILKLSEIGSIDWDNTEVVYEDIFYSYTMDLNIFRAQLEARRSEFNDNEKGYVYYIGSDARKYYQTTDANKLKGSESVTISVTCSDGAILGQGATRYKCRGCGKQLNAHTKECSMLTSVTESDLNTDELDQQKQDLRQKIESLKNEIRVLSDVSEALYEMIQTSPRKKLPNIGKC